MLGKRKPIIPKRFLVCLQIMGMQPLSSMMIEMLLTLLPSTSMAKII